MWQTEGDMMAHDTNVSFYMMNHKVKWTKTKKTKSIEGPKQKNVKTKNSNLKTLFLPSS